MWWTFLQRLHRQSTGGTSLGHAIDTWFNQLIPSTLLYFVRSTNTSSFFLLTSNPALTRFIVTCLKSWVVWYIVVRRTDSHTETFQIRGSSHDDDGQRRLQRSGAKAGEL
jgi:hypothetical protein